MTKRTFFDYLGIAHLEKIHSQTISWILSNENNGLNAEQKKKIITDLFEIDDFEIEENITEYDGVDLVFKFTNSIICIENKLNSSIHSEQLNRYEDKIKLRFPKLKPKFFLLSLINEETKNDNWEKITYSKLLQVIEKSKLNDNINGAIIKEYIQTLKNLKIIATDFTENPANYSNVFKDGHKRKSVKLMGKDYNKNQDFIRQNQLETTLQKLYYQRVIGKLKLKEHYIFETRGNAILATTILKKQSFKNEKFDFGFSFQNGTFKIFCIVTNYEKSKPTDIPNEIVEIFETIKKEHNCFRLNKPKTKGQYSLTKRNKNLIGISIKSFAEEYEKELNFARNIINRIKNTLANSGYAPGGKSSSVDR